MMGEVTIPVCRKCNSKQSVRLRYNLTGNGVPQHFWYCLHCECLALKPAKFIPHETIKSWEANGKLDSSYWDKGLLNDYGSAYQCEIPRCDAYGTELHHWAPSALADYFGNEWTQWPTIHLCPYHHRLWHVLVTPYLPGFRDDPRAQEIRYKYLSTYYEKMGV